MFSYLKGTVTEIEPTHITLDLAGVGYRIVSPNPYAFMLNESATVYIHQVVREDDITLYGFATIEAKRLFTELLSVKGIGPKSALVVIASADVAQIVQAIEAGDSKYLNRFPGIGPKASQQIILDLKGKINLEAKAPKPSNKLDEVADALRALGYKPKEINRATSGLDEKKTTETLIKDALKRLAK